jgi:ferredoxin
MENHLAGWTSPPMLLVQPRVEHVPMFSFDHTPEMIVEGRRAMGAALDESGEVVQAAPGGIFPKRMMQLGVLRERCIGCGACLALAPPGTFTLDDGGKAVARPEPVAWSAVDGGYVRHCPTYAITAHPAPPAAAASTGGASTGTARARA